MVTQNTLISFVMLKADAPDAQKNFKKMKKILKVTVNYGQVMFSGEIYYYWPVNSSEKVDKIVGKTLFFFA